MFKKILVATDASECSRKATEQAVLLAKECGASLVAMTASDVYPAYMFTVKGFADLQRLVEENGREILSDVEKLAAAVEVPCITKWVADKAPFKAILAVAEEEGCDLLVMGSHGHSGFVATMLGSVTQKVLAQAKIPVLVIR